MLDAAELTTRLAEIIAIRSINPMADPTGGGMGSHEVVGYLERWFSGRPIHCKRQSLSNGEVNLIARLAGRDRSATILFDAHTDTVPAGPWGDEAFCPRRLGGRLYGRGACDDKGALVAMAGAMVAAAESGSCPCDVVFLASADEEYARTGVREYLRRDPAPTYAVVGEPTNCRPVIACKGAARCELIVRGRGAHTSVPGRGASAITRMATVLQSLGAYEREVLARRSHPLTDPPTLTVTMIRGGTAVNIVPEECSITIDLRTLPQDDPRETLEELETYLKGRCDFPVERGGEQFWPGADSWQDDRFIAHCVACCAATIGPSSARPQGVNFGCHASEYTTRGVPALVLGPGSIDSAHTSEEHVDLGELAQAAQVYHRMMTTDFERHAAGREETPLTP